MKAVPDAKIITMEVFKLQLMTVFKYSFYLSCTKIYKCPKVQSIATGITVTTKKYIWSALRIIIVLFDVNCLRLLVPQLNVFTNGVYFDLSDYFVPMDIYDIFKLILSILFLHFYIKYFTYKREWESYKWLENFIIIGSYIGVFTTVLTLSCIGLIIVPNTTFEKIKFIILLIVGYFAYYTACTTDWFDKYTYSKCYTYTSTVKHSVLKDRKYLIVSNLATRWHTKKIKKITQKENKNILLAKQDPRLNRHVLVNKGLKNKNNQFTSLNTSQSLDGKGEYLISTRIMRPDSYYDQFDTSAWGKSELNGKKKSPKKIRQYKLIPM